MSRPSSARPPSCRPGTSRGATVVPSPKLRDYVFVEKLGCGTYATVYKAYKKTGYREVAAVKCVLKSSLNKSSTENLLTEIALLKKLKHDNIVLLKDFQWDDIYIYLIMEYCSGGDLSQFIRSKRLLPERIVRKFLRHIVSAMQFLREHKVAHMDLKPQNILCTSASDPVLKIADFGFAKHMYTGDELHALRGSPLYMAPEIICKGQYDARVDLWSIGVILYECLFGRPPYASKSFRELEEKIWDPKPVELPYGVEVSDNCRDLLLRLLKRNPDERISFEEFFVHPFLDLEHIPSSRCLSKATSLVKEAVALDAKGDYPEAVKIYCQAVEFFLPAIKYERDPSKKDILRKRAQEYINRAAEIKTQLKPVRGGNSPLQQSPSNNTEEELFHLFSGCEVMQAAIKVTHEAVIEEDKEEFEQSLKHYELALGTAIRYLKSEQAGHRKDLLREAVEQWMSRAETIKKYLTVKSCDDSIEQQQQEEEKEENESKILFSGQDGCQIQ
ncbi:serine/threonine-protein kinase ULK3-like isoform X3 [Mya arenaria]|uniref:serine/threonine-protein kinase ULK3-like isoform X3 n=1 Tax=Mya arenaria TaxID=6604 RepID=UPI0022E23EF2|nr:serine/threonine-protein kinase ULK3-like isoform X3 [Mya arenaria]